MKLHFGRVARLAVIFTAIVSLALCWPSSLRAASTSFTHEAADRFYAGFEKVVRGTVASANADGRLALKVESLFKDESDRIFLDVTGRARFVARNDPAKTRERLAGSRGYHLETNGSVGVDFSIGEVREVDPRTFDVEFELSVVIVVRPFFEHSTEFALNTLGALPMSELIACFVEFLSAISADRLGHALLAGLDHVARFVSGEPAHADEAAAPYQMASQELKKGVTPLGVLCAIGVAAIKGATKMGMKAAGLTFGAAIGASLAPASGAAVGAILGGVAGYLIGGVIVNKVLVEGTMGFRVWRIKRFLARGDLDRKARQEGKILDIIREEMEEGRTRTFDLVLDELRRMKAKGESLEPFKVLARGIGEHMQYRVLQLKDWSSARKYHQLQQLIDVR